MDNQQKILDKVWDICHNENPRIRLDIKLLPDVNEARQARQTVAEIQSKAAIHPLNNIKHLKINYL